MSARRSSVAHSLTGRPSWLPDSSQHDSAGVPPAIRTYLYEQEHGTFRRYLLEACVVLGVFLPWVAPLIGLCAIAPIVQLALLDSRVITPSADCYGPEGGVCNNEVYFDYYFWNITNPVEVSPALCSAVPARPEQDKCLRCSERYGACAVASRCSSASSAGARAIHLQGTLQHCCSWMLSNSGALQ